MFIRILKSCELGKAGRILAKPNRPQLAFAKRNPSIARIIYDMPVIKPEPIEPKRYEPVVIEPETFEEENYTVTEKPKRSYKKKGVIDNGTTES